MRAKIAELKEQRASCFEQMRAIVTAAESRSVDTGVLTSEEQQEFDRLKADASALKARAENMEEVAGLETRERRQIAPGITAPAGADGEIREAAAQTFAEYRAKSNGRGIDQITGTDE